MQIKGYRYLEEQFAADFAGGRVRLGTAASYAMMEDPHQDELDAAVRRDLDHLEIADSGLEPASTALLASMGIRVSDSKNVIVSEAKHIVHSAPMFMLCLSDAPDNREFLDKGKTAVFEIPDVERFAESVRSGGAPRLTTARFGAVRYEQREFDAKITPMLVPDPFIKRPQYASEREIRIIWETADGRADEPIFVSADHSLAVRIA